MPNDSPKEVKHAPGLWDKLAGAWLAFRTDQTEWEPSSDCIYCGAATYKKWHFDEDIYKTRCFNCGSTGTGGPVRDETENSRGQVNPVAKYFVFGGIGVLALSIVAHLALYPTPSRENLKSAAARTASPEVHTPELVLSSIGLMLLLIPLGYLYLAWSGDSGV